MTNSEQHRPAVVCLAAGKSQLAVISKARALGFAVLAVDRDTKAPGFALSDEQIEVGTYDSGPIIERLRPLQRRFRLVGVINHSSGPPVVTAAEICRAFGLPGVPPESARAIVDKAQLMASCAERGIPAPVCQSATSFEDIDTARLRYPCVVKPALSLVGKSGVRVVKATDGLASAFREALKASINGVVNVEELVPGRNVALMAVVHEGRLSPITLFDELNSTDDGGSLRGVARVVPSVFSGRPEEERIVALGQKVVDQFGLDTTAFVMSCRCSQGGRPKLIEVHLEIGGDLVHDVLLPASTSFDVLAYVIQTLAGDSRHHETIEFRPAAVIFGQGEGLVSERPYDVLTAPSRAALERTLEAKQVFADA